MAGSGGTPAVIWQLPLFEDVGIDEAVLGVVLRGRVGLLGVGAVGVGAEYNIVW